MSKESTTQTPTRMTEHDVRVFTYGHLQERFDTIVFDYDENAIRNMKIRARVNSHRDLQVYAVLLTVKEMEIINEEMDDPEVDEVTVFQHLLELGAKTI